MISERCQRVCVQSIAHAFGHSLEDSKTTYSIIYRTMFPCIGSSLFFESVSVTGYNSSNFSARHAKLFCKRELA